MEPSINVYCIKKKKKKGKKKKKRGGCLVSVLILPISRFYDLIDPISFDSILQGWVGSGSCFFKGPGMV